MASLARLGLLKSGAFLGLSGNEYDEVLKALLQAATTWAEKYCQRQLVSATVTSEAHVGDGSKRLWPREYPVTSLTSMTIWDGSAHTAETASYAEIINQRVLLYPKLGSESDATYGSWPDGHSIEVGDLGDYNIRLTYVAGYSTTNWASETVILYISTLTTAPAVGDVLTQLNSGATLTVTAASAATDQITATVTSGPLKTDDLDTDTFTSNNTGATMAPTPITATRINYVLSGAFSVPADLEFAVADIAHLMWMEGKGSNEGRRGKTTQSVGDQGMAYERLEHGLSQTTLNILKSYKRPDY